MDAAALDVLRTFGDIRLGFGESDEYSFVFHKSTTMYSRRSSKLSSLVVSCFSAAYVRFWPAHLPTTPLKSTPVFDARAVCYPTEKSLRDYLAWRQADTHINNQVRQRGSLALAHHARPLRHFLPLVVGNGTLACKEGCSSLLTRRDLAYSGRMLCHALHAPSARAQPR